MAESSFVARRSLGWIAIAVLATAIVDGLLYRLLLEERSDFYVLALGFYTGQFVLLGIWFVFGPQTFAVRTFGSLAAAALLIAALSLSSYESFANWSTKEYLTALLMESAALPLQGLAGTAVLWPFRIWGGWRIARASDAALQITETRWQFRIGDLLVITAFVAVILASARAQIEMYQEETRGRLDGIWVWVYMVIALLGAAIGLPSLVLAMIIDRAGSVFTTTVFYIGLSSLWVLIFAGSILGAQTDFELVLFVLGFQSVALATAVGVLRFFRRQGYVLIRPRRTDRSRSSTPPLPGNWPAAT